MSILKLMSEVVEVTSESLSNTTWSFTYLGATGSLSFQTNGAGTITYPNGSSYSLYWCESGDSFWINITAFSGWFELMEGTHSGGQGSGSMIEANTQTSGASKYPFTMTTKTSQDMSSNAAAQSSLFGTTWNATPAKHDVVTLRIDFNNPHTCVVTFLQGRDPHVSCNWSEDFSGGVHHFGLVGGSVSLHGSCSVASGSGQAIGFAAGQPSENWTLSKQ